MMDKGILIIDKPKDFTSRDVVNKLNYVFKTKKIGHTGTLDPLATGVLVIAIGKYTKLVNVLTCLDKEYIAEVKLGIKTDTGDITGNIVENSSWNFTKEELNNVLSSFVGKYIETVPIYSAIKVNGKKLYEYARAHEKVTLPTREVEIKEINLINYKDNKFTFQCVVSKGTYIRSLIEDICAKIGTIGVMSDLRRVRQGKFRIEDSYTLGDIEKGNFKFCDIKDYLDVKVINVDYDLYCKIKNGVKVPNIYETEENILFTYNNEYIAIYRQDKNLLKPYIMF